ncbi:hypothetical protein F5B17DRAFT_454594 [Nemania serpens]|nr:hypothetical protein F5B17DRAFT_454594 [Nemania serpens]
MHYSLDGHGLSREQLQAKAEAEAAAIAGQLDGDPSHHETAHPGNPTPSSTCEWRGDAAEPELDDLAHPPEQIRQPPRPANACDWRGDEPGPDEDNLGRIFQQDDDQAQRPGQRGEQVGEAGPYQMPVPRPSKVAGISETLFPSAGDQSTAQDRDPVLPSVPESLAEDENKPKRGKEQKKMRIQTAANQSPAEGKTHSPWVDSLDRMPTTMMEKVNMGVKQTLEAATSRLTPSVRKQSRSSDPNVKQKKRRTSGLAPESAAPPPPDFYVSMPTQPLPGQSTDEEVEVGNKKHEKEKKRSEKKARHEARRKARQEKSKEKKDKRKQDKERRQEVKERRQKEKDWKKVEKKGGKLPAQLQQGLRIAPGSEIPYDSRCDICTKSAASAMSSKKRDPKCTICAKADEQETTKRYLQSLKINLADSPPMDGILDSIIKLLRKQNRTTGGSPADENEHVDEDLARHILLHVHDLATCGGEANLSGHKCNSKGQPGHLARHGLDGNRDSPTTTEGGQVVPSSGRSSRSSTPPTPSEVDWWVQAVSSNDSPSSSYRRPNSSPEVIRPLQR